jgi:hypothetical protein
MKTRKPDYAKTSTGSKEFMEEQLYQPALRGAYQQEFDLVKACIPQLAKYRTVPEFMKAMWKHNDLREKMVRLLEMLWKTDFARRPALGLVLMLAMWHNAIGSGEDYWSDLFINLAAGKDGDLCKE